MLRLLAVTLALAVAACADELPDKPIAPDMTALVDAYATPTAAFDQPTGDELVDRIVGRFDALEQVDELQGFLDEVLEPSLEEGEPAGVSAARVVGERRSFTVEGDGFLEIRHICRGFGAEEPPVDAEVNGEASFTVGFTETGLDPVMWGGFVDCELVIDDREVRLDGGASLYLGENLMFDGFGTAPILFELDGTIEVDGEELASPAFDFQLCPTSATACTPGTIEILLETDGGEHLTFFLDGGRVAGGFRANNGLWDCSFDAGGAVCVQDGADDVVLAELVIP